MRINVPCTRVVICLGTLLLAVSAFGTSLRYSAIRPEGSGTDLLPIHTEWADHLAPNHENAPFREFLELLKTQPRSSRPHRQPGLSDPQSNASLNSSESSASATVGETALTGTNELTAWRTPDFSYSWPAWSVSGWSDWASNGSAQSGGAGQQLVRASAGDQFQTVLSDPDGDGDSSPDKIRTLRTMLHDEPGLTNPLDPVPEPGFTAFLLAWLLIGGLFISRRAPNQR
jgi:hypothetical protein